MDYVTYDYYANKYCGGDNMVVAAENFHKYLLQAQSAINLYTFGRCGKLQSIPVEIKNCCCELIEVINNYNSKLKNTNGVQSEKIKNYSVTYESTQNLKSQLENEKVSIINRWLASTGLLYRGC